MIDSNVIIINNIELNILVLYRITCRLSRVGGHWRFLILNVKFVCEKSYKFVIILYRYLCYIILSLFRGSTFPVLINDSHNQYLPNGS